MGPTAAGEQVAQPHHLVARAESGDVGAHLEDLPREVPPQGVALGGGQHRGEVAAQQRLLGAVLGVVLARRRPPLRSVEAGVAVPWEASPW